MVSPMLPQSAFQPAPAVPPRTQLNPQDLLAALRELAPAPRDFSPKYPPGYEKPKKPKPGEVVQRAKQLYDDMSNWRNLIEITWAWTHHERVGMFPEDAEDRRNGLQEEFISTFLSTKRNSVISRVASAKMGMTKPFYHDDLRRKAQMMEDAAKWLQEEFAYQWAEKGQRSLALDEALLFADRGMYVSRQVLDLSGGVETSGPPINIDLIEPTEVYPIWGGRKGLKEVYRVKRDTWAWAEAEYGGFTKGIKQKLKDRYGTDPAEHTELPITEFWDSWHRMILIEEQPIIDADHEYGYAPWTIRYGGFGDAMFTRAPGGGSTRNWGEGFYEVDRSRRSQRHYQAVPLIYFDIRSHEIYEAVMGRVLTGFKREINPPIERARSTMLYGTDMGEVSQAPGAVTETVLGEEQLRPMPQMTNSPITGFVAGVLQQEQASRGVGLDDKVGQSNVSGAALGRFDKATDDHLLPIFQSLELAKAHQIGQIFQTLGNFGHLAKYGGDEERPLMVPGRRPGLPRAFELSRELIDELGPRIAVKYSNPDRSQWPAMAASGRQLIEMAVLTPEELREEVTGETDWDDHFERWMQTKATMNALEHPKYNEMFNIPAMLAEQIVEAAGDPEMVEFWTKQLKDWMTMVQQSAQQQPQMPGMGGSSMQQQGPAPGNMGAPAGTPVPPDAFPQAPPGMAAPVAGGGGSLPGMIGPGSQGGQVGRPY